MICSNDLKSAFWTFRLENLATSYNILNAIRTFLSLSNNIHMILSIFIKIIGIDKSSKEETI